MPAFYRQDAFLGCLAPDCIDGRQAMVFSGHKCSGRLAKG